MTRAELIEIIEGELPTSHFSNGEGGNVCCDYGVLADFILNHTEELRKENELLKEDSKRLVSTAQHAHEMKSRFEIENAELKALVDEVRNILETVPYYLRYKGEPLSKALAKIAEFKKGGE